jgi:K+-sensing histidine kinase KdpD
LPVIRKEYNEKNVPGIMAKIYKSLPRATASAAAVALVAVVCSNVFHVDRLAAGLILPVTVLEAIISALVGSLALDYLFNPPFGFSIKSPEDGLPLLVFLVVSITTDRLSTKAKQWILDAVQRRCELEKLYALAILKFIVEPHGGKIWVTREQEKGSTFSFSLPL